MRKLWHSDYWDGPINGLCIVNDEKCWYEMIEENSDSGHDVPDEPLPWYRRYLVWKLTDEQLNYVEVRHEKFRRMVGTHSDYVYDENDACSRGKYQPNGELTSQYYEEARIEADLEKPLNISPAVERIIGWHET